jgi:hypothetical protein
LYCSVFSENKIQWKNTPALSWYWERYFGPSSINSNIYKKSVNEYGYVYFTFLLLPCKHDIMLIFFQWVETNLRYVYFVICLLSIMSILDSKYVFWVTLFFPCFYQINIEVQKIKSMNSLRPRLWFYLRMDYADSFNNFLTSPLTFILYYNIQEW